MHFISSVTYPDKTIQDKINYFVDCIELMCPSISYPLCPINLDAKLLCIGLQKLVLSRNAKRIKYVKHYFDNYKKLIDVDDLIIKKYYIEQFKKLNQELKTISRLKVDANHDFTNLLNILSEINTELSESYFENVIKELSTAVLCKENLSKHNHRGIIEHCANIIVVEFSWIGYSKNDVRTAFQTAIMHRADSIDDIDKSNVYKIPVPQDVYQHREETYTKYKNRVKKYLKSSTLPDQFKNLVYIFNQSQHKKKFVFKIRNIRIYENETKLEFNNTLFSRSIQEKYVKKNTRKLYKDYFKVEANCMFCETEIFSGNNTDALQKAIVQVNESLNFINANIGEKTRRAYLDLSEYIVIDSSSASKTKKSAISINKFDLKNLNHLSELEKLNNNPSVSQYLKIDKIYFEAFTSEIDPFAVSSLWRYCESLFIDDKDVHEIQKRILNYYCKRTKQNIYLGPWSRINYFSNDYYHNGKQNTLGLTNAEYYALLNKQGTLRDCVSDWNKIIRHPLINKISAKSLALSDEKVFTTLYVYYELLLKEAYLLRNLYQHSNIIIEEFQNIWLEMLIDFIGSLRWLIIDDLKAKPNIQNIEDVFI